MSLKTIPKSPVYQSNPCYDYAIRLSKKILQQKIPLNDVLEQYYPEYYAKLQETIDSFNQQSPQPIACKKQCDACCHYMVASVPMEAKYIQYSAKNHLSAKELKIVSRKLRQVRSKEREFEKQSPNNIVRQAQLYRLSKIPCPFLKDKTCMIYHYRPMICRYHNVTGSPENCYHPALNNVQAWQHPQLMESDVNFQKFMSHHYLNTSTSGTLNQLLLDHGF
ncbi:MAG: YkgJ family cysteine cluster protein [Candidatus Magnetomorum sp.]|nr:YkgJ family cysteine cluster protein [Candidatus Magnetomorum sp.]